MATIEVNIENLFTILESSEETVVGANVKGGLTYVYEWKEKKKQKDWRADQYRWRSAGSHSYKLKDGRKGKKLYYYSIDGKNKDKKDTYTTNFQRLVYFHPDHPQKVLIQYIGDVSVATKLPHGNAVNEPAISRPFCASANSVLRQLEKDVGPPSVAYSNALLAAPKELARHPSHAPRSLGQVQNILKRFRERLRLSRDAIFNLRELAGDTNFISDVVIHPDLVVIGFDEEIVKVLLGLLNRTDLPSIGMFYDTTFNLGDFYLSIVSFTEQEFDPAPIIPVFYMLHERKTQETHDFFWRRISQQIIPQLAKAKNVYIVTDEETAIVNAIQTFLPNLPIYRCWNHVLMNVSKKVTELLIENENQYVQDVRGLLKENSLEDYKNRLISHLVHWNKEFAEYFLKNINPDIDRMGSWIIREHGLESATSNRAESINATVKRFADWKEAPADCMVLMLFRLFHSIFINIMRGRYLHLGEFNLRPELQELYDVLKDAPILPDVVQTIEEMFLRIRNAANDIPDEPSIENDPDMCESPDEFKEEDDPVKKAAHTRLLTAYERATRVIENKNLWFVLEKRAFEVKGTLGMIYTVELFPKRNCTCPSNVVCYHILACQMAIRLCNTDTKRPGNTALYRRTVRRRQEKISGRKKPRPRDTRNREHVDDHPEEAFYDAFEPSQEQDYLLRKNDKQKFYAKRKSTLDTQELDSVSRPSPLPFVEKEPKLKASIKKKNLVEFETDSSKFFTRSPIKTNVTEEETYSLSLSPIVQLDLPESPFNSFNYEESLFEESFCISQNSNKGGSKNIGVVGSSSLHSLKVLTQSPIKTKSTEEETCSLSFSPKIPLDLPDPPFNCVESLLEESSTLQDESNRRIADCSKVVFSQNSNKGGTKIVRVVVSPVIESSNLQDESNELIPDSCEVVFSQNSNKGGSKNVRQQKKTGAIAEQLLSEKELKMITPESWLHTSHINAGQSLLRKKASLKDIGGLFNVEYGSFAQFPPVIQLKWIQIVHNGIDHWVVVAHGFDFDDNNNLPSKEKPLTVKVFDSLQNKKANPLVVACCASLLYTNEREFRLDFMYNQRQTNGYDCGVYAIAFAMSLIEGENPCKITYDTRKLRKHFKSCLQSGEMTSFPQQSHRGPNDRSVAFSTTVQVFCTCRRPAKFSRSKGMERSEEMAECDDCHEWFHRDCVKIPANVFKKENIEWRCPACLKITK